MSLDPEWRDLGARLKLLVFWLLAVFMDTGFLAGWLAIQFAANDYVIQPLQSHLSDIEKSFLLAFQILFGLGTSIPIAVYVIVDVRKIILQAWKAMR